MMDFNPAQWLPADAGNAHWLGGYNTISNKVLGAPFFLKFLIIGGHFLKGPIHCLFKVVKLGFISVHINNFDSSQFTA